MRGWSVLMARGKGFGTSQPSRLGSTVCIAPAPCEPLHRGLSRRATMTSDFGCGASRGSADGSQFSAGGTAAEERVAAVRLESRYGDAGRHVELLQNLAALRIDPTQFAFLVFQGPVPELAVHPGYASHEAV